MSGPLNILYVTSEVVPFMKTGGLADVSEALPRALRAQGHDVRVVLPCYGTIPEDLKGVRSGPCSARFNGDSIFAAWRTARFPDSDMPVYLIEHDLYFWRDHPYGKGNTEYPDNLERFCFFCMAVLDFVPQTGWVPDVIHCHDWHTATIPAYIKTRFVDHPLWGAMPTVFTIHNLAYQGRFASSLMPKTGLGWELFTPKYVEYYGDINLMKAGITFASKLNTVSRTYAKEIQTELAGHGLEGVLRTRADDLCGIQNGVDLAVWNPTSDRRIPANFSVADQAGKRVCKEALQTRLGLDQKDVPIFSMVSRLVWDKGISALVTSLDQLLKKDIQVVLLGSGDLSFEQALLKVAQDNPGKMSVTIGYNEDLAHLIYAGSDFYMMPSRTEPCGLSQMYSMLYGTIPVVHRTGGLADTVTDATPGNLASQTATGIVFNTWSDRAFINAVNRALRLYGDASAFEQVRRTGMRRDFSWERSAREYVQLFREAVAAP
ncbi:MAG: glycogen synthase GlgA [Candidatus Hydrogenedentes bacterium]|nr:glycogen synthase GlgA [Candidatus Hydrogenedentota bacterium]